MTGKRLMAIGINIDGVLEHDGLPALSFDERFARVANAGVFDYAEVNLWPGDDVLPVIRASEGHGVPIGVMGGIFCLGDDTLPEYAARNGAAAALGCRVFNCQVFARDQTGVALTLQRMGEFYLRLMEIGVRSGCLPSLEVHVDMWTEQFGRVAELGDWLERRGVPLRLTLDHSHLLFKLGDQEELALCGLAGLDDGGHALLHPDSATSLYAQWLARGWVVHAHARSVQSPGVPNPWMRRGELAGRGIQYPFTAPAPGSYHGPWDESELAPWKLAVTQLLDWKKAHRGSPLAQISCEFIPFADYGGASRYSILEQNVACARWLAQLQHA
ncbi:xylose isomerase [Janthinobacterium sp. PSPC3-1]|uniref:xylose isomerase n=1 Tax=Janthinobacterium sp. PSPC3-1 TaxID=2804653 RepID=UPI003CF8CF97